MSRVLQIKILNTRATLFDISFIKHKKRAQVKPGLRNLEISLQYVSWRIALYPKELQFGNLNFLPL